MIPYEVDPSLHDGPPTNAAMGDGFSPPPMTDEAEERRTPAEPVLTEKSDF